MKTGTRIFLTAAVILLVGAVLSDAQGRRGGMDSGSITGSFLVSDGPAGPIKAARARSPI